MDKTRVARLVSWLLNASMAIISLFFNITFGITLPFHHYGKQ